MPLPPSCKLFVSSTAQHQLGSSPLENFPWPKYPPSINEVKWDGDSFVIAGTRTRVLSYQSDESHWSDDLTEMHESISGNNHPVDLASQRLAIESMRRVSTRENATLIDVGCSSGYIISELQMKFPNVGLIGADYLLGPLTNALMALHV